MDVANVRKKRRDVKAGRCEGRVEGGGGRCEGRGGEGRGEKIKGGGGGGIVGECFKGIVGERMGVRCSSSLLAVAGLCHFLVSGEEGSVEWWKKQVCMCDWLDVNEEVYVMSWVFRVCG